MYLRKFVSFAAMIAVVWLMGGSVLAAPSKHRFQVGDNSYVYFSPGNLQYNAALGSHQTADGKTLQGTWRFAEHQWDFVGWSDSKGSVYYNGNLCNNEKRAINYAGWIDLFGYATSGYNNGTGRYQPWEAATSNYFAKNSAGTYQDFGIYNQIGNDAPGTWRLLTVAEWRTLYNRKKDGKALRSGCSITASVDGFNKTISGIILLPDDWDFSKLSLNSSYTEESWAKMEAAGAVFLPDGGWCTSGTYGSYLGTNGSILWSADVVDSTSSIYVAKTSSVDGVMWTQTVGSGTLCAVRLVQDIDKATSDAPMPNDNPFFKVGDSTVVYFSPGNLQYNAALGSHQTADGKTLQGTWRFAEHQWDFVGGKHYKGLYSDAGTVYKEDGKTLSYNNDGSETYNGWIDWFSWGMSGYSKTYPWEYKTGPMSDAITNSNFDWGVYNQIGDDAPGTWRLLTRTEWDALLKRQKDGKLLYGHGQITATVNGKPKTINGLILLPDNWDVTYPSFKYGKGSYSSNSYTEATWAQMEAAGAVFLPAGGARDGDWVIIGTQGNYHSSSINTYKKNHMCMIPFAGNYVSTNYAGGKWSQRSVRLVRGDAPEIETIIPPEPDNIDSLKTDSIDPYIVCAGQEYVWQGKGANGQDTVIVIPADAPDEVILEAHYQTVHGCDSSFMRKVAICHPFFSDTTIAICQGETITWHGETYDQAGTYYDRQISYCGCDSVYKLTLIYHPTFFAEASMAICSGEAYSWHGKALTAAGIYYDSLKTMNGCDSVYKLTLVVNPTFFAIDTVSLCANELPYTWHGRTFDSAGTFYDRHRTVNGCDSVYELRLNVKPTFFARESFTTCQFDTSFRWLGHENIRLSVETAGDFTYTDTLKASNGCDSICELNLHINPMVEHVDTLYACASDKTFDWKIDTTFIQITLPQASFETQNVERVEYLPNEYGCLEKHQLQLVVWPAYFVKEE